MGSQSQQSSATRATGQAVQGAGEDWEVLSVHDLDEQIWATPAVDDDQVIVRTQESLYCFEGEPDG